MDLYTCLQNIYIYWCNCRNAILRFFNLQVTEKASSGHGCYVTSTWLPHEETCSMWNETTSRLLILLKSSRHTSIHDFKHTLQFTSLESVRVLLLFNNNTLNESTVFNINNNINKKNKCFLSTKSEWFLKDHVTLKTGVMAAENIDLPS